MVGALVVEKTVEIQCPNCSTKFPLAEGITEQTLALYESEYEQFVTQEAEKRAQALVDQEIAEVEHRYKRELRKLGQELVESRESLEEAEERRKKARQKGYEKAKKDFVVERSSLQEELELKDGEIRKLKEFELELRKDRKKLQEEKRNFELEIQRKLAEETERLRKEIGEAIRAEYVLREADYRKKLADAREANEDLKRKLEQGSQQLRGEVLELEVEEFLKTAYPADDIEPVKKGATGADILQHVRTKTGQLCGKIIWETKRAKNWSNKWIEKLKDDRIEAQADIAILISTTLPKDADGPFLVVGDIWIADWSVLHPIAEALRHFLLQAYQVKSANVGRAEKTELLYDYLCSPAFTQKVRAVVETFTAMRSDLEQERNALQKIWAKRAKQLERVTLNICNVVGEIQAISQESVLELDAIQELVLPAKT